MESSGFSKISIVEKKHSDMGYSSPRISYPDLLTGCEPWVRKDFLKKKLPNSSEMLLTVVF